MSKKSRNQLLIELVTEVQYFSLEPLLDRLREGGFLFDILVPTSEGDNTESITSATLELLKVNGFSNIIRDHGNKAYKVALLPEHLPGVDVEYKLKYDYAPTPYNKVQTMSPEAILSYHAFLSQSRNSMSILKVSTNPILVPSLKFINFKRKRATKQKTVLYLPTWQDVNSLSEISEGLGKLKEHGYRVIAKMHHGTTHRKSEVRGDSIAEIVDEYYLSDTNIVDLFKKSDLVISDSSGAIFEALYVGIPVIVFGSKLNQMQFAGINTEQYELVQEGVLLNPNSADELVDVMERAFSEDYLMAQKEYSDDNYLKDFTERAVDSYIDVINAFLEGEVDKKYIKMHDYLADDYAARWDKIVHLNNALESSLYREQNPGIRVAVRRLVKAVLYKLGIMNRKRI